MKKIVALACIAALLTGCSSSEDLQDVSKTEEVTEDHTDAAYAAYYNVLKDNRDAIYSYENSLDTGYSYAATNSKQTALVDITKDGIPELIFFTGEHDNAVAVMHIYSYLNDSAVRVYHHDGMPVQVAGGCYYQLFQTEKGGPLYFMESAGDENWSTSITRFELEGKTLVSNMELLHESKVDYDNNQSIDSYYLDEKSLSEDEYNEEINNIQKSIQTVITWNLDYPKPIQLPDFTIKAKHVDDILAELGGIEEMPSTNNESSTAEQPAVEQQAPANTGSFLIPDSNTRYISSSELSGFSYDDCQLAINEIYARHGRKFVTPEIQAYFNNQSWYTPTIEAANFDNSMLSDVERANVETIVAYETAMGWR
ncbi:MAG: YARHG domain-containing protein [Faecalicoccus sp.]|nr:YARHG domain-containing protein [Faecalicoccus sp.]